MSPGLLAKPFRAPTPAPAPAPSRREQARQQRSVFLRRFRTCGEVKRAAKEAGIAHATLYRWRLRNEDFRERWDSVADQRRFDLEDRMMQLAREGEKTAVFHKGEQVGWRVSHTARPVLAMLAYLDRREKLRIEEEERASESHYSRSVRGENARSAGSNDDDDDFEEGDDFEEDEVEAEGETAENAGEEDESEEDEEEEEAADAALAAAPAAAPVPPEEDKIWVRIVHVPWFDNTQLHLPGKIVELPGGSSPSEKCMVKLTPEEVREHLAAVAQGHVRGHYRPERLGR